MRLPKNLRLSERILRDAANSRVVPRRPAPRSVLVNWSGNQLADDRTQAETALSLVRPYPIAFLEPTWIKHIRQATGSAKRDECSGWKVRSGKRLPGNCGEQANLSGKKDQSVSSWDRAAFRFRGVTFGCRTRKRAS